MKKWGIEVLPGYYEWHILVDNQIIYNINDGFQENFENKAELETFVDEAIRCISDEAKDCDNEEYTGFCDDIEESKKLWLCLSQDDLLEVRKQLILQWSRYID